MSDESIKLHLLEGSKVSQELLRASDVHQQSPGRAPNAEQKHNRNRNNHDSIERSIPHLLVDALCLLQEEANIETGKGVRRGEVSRQLLGPTAENLGSCNARCIPRPPSHDPALDKAEVGWFQTAWCVDGRVQGGTPWAILKIPAACDDPLAHHRQGNPARHPLGKSTIQRLFFWEHVRLRAQPARALDPFNHALHSFGIVSGK